MLKKIKALVSFYIPSYSMGAPVITHSGQPVLLSIFFVFVFFNYQSLDNYREVSH